MITITVKDSDGMVLVEKEIEHNNTFLLCGHPYNRRMMECFILNQSIPTDVLGIFRDEDLYIKGAGGNIRY